MPMPNPSKVKINSFFEKEESDISFVSVSLEISVLGCSLLIANVARSTVRPRELAVEIKFLINGIIKKMLINHAGASAEPIRIERAPKIIKVIRKRIEKNSARIIAQR